MIVVIKKKGESKDKIFKKFTRTFQEEDVIYDVNRKMAFKPPAIAKKEKKREKIRRQQRSSYGRYSQ